MSELLRTLIGFVANYSFTLLVTLWTVPALFAYTLKANSYSSHSPFTHSYIDPAIAYLKGKVLTVGVDVVFVAFKRFRSHMGADSNIEYFEKYCIVHVRDRGRHHKVYLPFRQDLKKHSRFKIMAEAHDDNSALRDIEGTSSKNSPDLRYIHTVPGVPIMVSPQELGKEVITCSKPNGEVIWSYRGNARPLYELVDKVL